MIRAFHPLPPLRRGVSAAAHVDPEAEVSEDAFVGAGAIVGGRSRIGARAQIMPGAVIGEDCAIGEETVVHSGAVLYPQTSIGRRCILHANCVVGRDGFGFHRLESGELLPVPQIGRVEIADDVEIGACACVDRATLTVTEVGAGAKIDNQVHIAHNCRVGRNVLIAGQSIMAGSTRVGDGSTLWVRAALVDGVRLGPQTTMQISAVAAASHPGGETLAGFPAMPARLWNRCAAAYKRLPELVKLLPRRS
jgi:UDP-3-O-[3-hydroxymyristoyl] glucosamine N-acyltransferase